MASDQPWMAEKTKLIEFEEQVQQPVADETEQAGAGACEDDPSITVVISDAKEGEPKHWDISVTSSEKVSYTIKLLASILCVRSLATHSCTRGMQSSKE